jgi:PAS domain S-box-containing protein
MNNYRDVLEKHPRPVAVIEGPDYVVSYANAAFRAISGSPIGRPFTEFSAGPESARIDEAIARAARAGEVQRIECVMNGELCAGASLAVTAWPIGGSRPDHPCVAVELSETGDAAADRRITEELREINQSLVISNLRQQELAEAAEAAEQRLRDVVHGLGAIIYEVDIKTGKLNYISRQTGTFLGHHVDQWSDPDYWRLIMRSWEYKDLSKLIAESVAIGHDYEYEFPVFAADGSEVWLRNVVRMARDGHGDITLLRGVIMDISRERRAELALERQRRIAEALQRSILQDVPEDFCDGLSVAALYEPALNEALVGGDFYDAFRLPDGRALLAIGDVTGKGLAAATRTAEIKFALRAFAQEYPGPAEVTARLNDFLCSFHPPNNPDDNTMIVMSLMAMDPDNGRALVTPAGIEPPLIVRRNGEIEQIPPQGLILGIERGADYAQATAVLDRGDMVIMATDGVTEARHGHDLFGYDRMARAAVDARMSESLHETGRAVLEAARDFAGGQFQDDVCMLLVKKM